MGVAGCRQFIFIFSRYVIIAGPSVGKLMKQGASKEGKRFKLVPTNYYARGFCIPERPSWADREQGKTFFSYLYGRCSRAGACKNEGEKEIYSASTGMQTAAALSTISSLNFS
jgi:hypothetical protein